MTDFGKFQVQIQVEVVIGHKSEFSSTDITFESQTTINDINIKMQDNQKSNQTLREDNMELASKLKSLLEEYRTREEVSLLLCFKV